MDSSAIVSVDPHRVAVVTPEDHALPAGGLNIRWPDTPLEQEERLLEHKLDAARAYGRANGLDRTVIDGPGRRLGIVTTGKSYLDVRQALDDLGIDEGTARRLGIVLYKVGMSWPLEPDGIRRFAGGLDEILVVEEKRDFIEGQIKELLYNLPATERPRVIGKCDEDGRPLLRASGELDPGGVAQTLAERLLRLGADESIEARLTHLRARWAESRAGEPAAMERVPYFCSGCPAQLVDQGAGGEPRARRHRLPLHGAVDGPRDRHLHPHGRRGCQLDRAGALHRDRAHLPEHRRRHLLPLRHSRDPGRGRRRRQT